MSAGCLKPTNLRCEYRENPIGIGEREPRLSWIPEPTNPVKRGIKQVAYQIQVTAADVGFDKPSAWDSKKVDSSQCNQIVYTGVPLESSKKYRWRVRLWDQDGKESDWSPVAEWRMGILEPSAWKAKWIESEAALLFDRCKWIWHPSEEAPEKGANAAIYAFQKKVTISGEVVHAKALLAADDEFVLHINGKLIYKSAGNTKEAVQPHIIDITSHLRSGENLLTVVATNKSNGDPAGVTGKFVARLSSQKQFLDLLDSSWKVSPAKSSTQGVSDTIADDAVDAKIIYAVGMTDPIAVPLTPWGVPGNEDALALPPVACFRKEFDVESLPSEAVLHASAFGIYEISINGKKVGDDFFTPGWTDFTKRVYTNSYDVARYLKKGKNVITAYLADGWFCGYVGWSRRRDHHGGQRRMIAQLELLGANGGKSVVGTDESWSYTTAGPFVEADLLMGEAFDARKVLSGWESADYDAADFQPVVISEDPIVPVQCYPGLPVRAIEEITPKVITEPRPGSYIFDMGQNFVGVVRVKTTGATGAAITLRYAEVLTEEGELYTEALRGARSRDLYIKATEDEEIYQARFTFHGFRFVEVTGLAAPPELDAVTGVVMHNEMERTGEWRTSNEMVNRLMENIRWGQKGNFLEVPTDCPQRDERMGWTGDAQIFIRTATYNYDVAPFFTKWMQDLFDAQRPEGWICCVAPPVNPWPNPDLCFAAWADAAIICPWTMYRVYGDTRLIERYWDGMVALMDYMERTSKNLIRPNEGFGDWVSLNSITPLDLLGTAYFAYDATLMAEMAEVIGKKDEAKRYTKLFEDIRTVWQKEYIEPDGGLRGRTQCAYVLALRFNLLPENLRKTAITFLAQDIAYRAGHFSTGFIGLKDLMPALTDSGRNDIACRILLNEDFPSWGYQIKHGATTVWERWDGWSEEMGLQTPMMNSFNHYAFGAVGEWMYSHLAGIDISEPSYRRIKIRPHPDGRLRYARARYRAATGWIHAEWIFHPRERRLEVRCRIPVGASADILLPTADSAAIVESGQPIANAAGLKLVGNEEGRTRLEAESGHYHFSFPWG